MTISTSDSTCNPAASLAPLITESHTQFTIKLDHIKRLDATTNYLSCRNQVSTYLHIMDIYHYIDRWTPNPTYTTQLATWTRNEYTVKAVMMSVLQQDFIYLASDAATDQGG